MWAGWTSKILETTHSRVSLDPEKGTDEWKRRQGPPHDSRIREPLRVGGTPVRDKGKWRVLSSNKDRRSGVEAETETQVRDRKRCLQTPVKVPEIKVPDRKTRKKPGWCSKETRDRENREDEGIEGWGRTSQSPRERTKRWIRWWLLVDSTCSDKHFYYHCVNPYL